MPVFSYARKDLAIFHHLSPHSSNREVHILSEDDPQPLLSQLPHQGLAIVGTRYPQRRSFELLEKTINELRGSDLVIVSGFARGIDSRAHDLAIECGLKTIAIVGCGIDVDYPRENRHLRKRVLESGGLVISPFAMGAPAYASHFLERNEWIAGFARATWVVEAAEISGTLNTANWAMKLNRDLFATSCFPGDVFFKGNEKLLSQKDPDRYPLAEPFFGVHSLLSSFPHLATQPTLPQSYSQLQRWILELQGERGDCHVQILMNHASGQGLTLGDFYRQFEKEIDEGRIYQDDSGRVGIAKCFT